MPIGSKCQLERGRVGQGPVRVVLRKLRFGKSSRENHWLNKVEKVDAFVYHVCICHKYVCHTFVNHTIALTMDLITIVIYYDKYKQLLD
jgi:hypothetical protein